MAPALEASTGLHKLRQPLLDGDEHTERQAAAALTLPQPSLSASRVDLDPEAPGSPTLAEEKHATRREMIGLAFNALSTLFGTGMSLFAKISGSQGIGVFNIVLTRSLILVLFTGPELFYHRVNPFHDRRRRWLLVLRGVLGFCSVSSLYLAVALLPLADASVLSFLSPIFVAALGPIILKERSSTGTLLGIPVAMVGVVLVAQPGIVFGGEDHISKLGVAVGITQACFNALARTCVRALSQGSSERMSSIIFGQGIISCLGAAILCTTTKSFQVPTEAPVWGALLAGGLLGYLYQLALTAGLQRARAAPAVAMSYLSVIWGILADIFVFHDLPDSLSLVGAAIICLSSFSVAFSQKRAGSRKTADARWQKSTARLQQEQEAGLLLGAADGQDGEEDESGASAEGASPAGASQAGSVGWAGGEAGELKAYVKLAATTVAAEVEAAAAAGEALEPPDTPAAPHALPPALQHGSADSLPLLGSSPPAPPAPASGWVPAGSSPR
ncbi:hypothetical protein CHLNCDRAFT_142523 [Chlorella variabilis]|uniref:EamA domain-containing protein n=1 Tax=Chlorella variabilis TaxID=554065 RepID=E1ZTU0_CHLVA|nr:hypothetical protein CHLNCDRAFT_142523 [Chlorella variabilis]EFN50789.1 hypothetical protein CHLNCDRAFT_142523 [Chlorella variabilis]|eukprot:XP_005852326.1 hypothetical protein CHLNCDRAFT_142523 [Chlorella variabilis]